MNKWRLRSESNRRTRSCSPLHDHSATQPSMGCYDNKFFKKYKQNLKNMNKNFTNHHNKLFFINLIDCFECVLPMLLCCMAIHAKQQTDKLWWISCVNKLKICLVQILFVWLLKILSKVGILVFLMWVNVCLVFDFICVSV